MPLTHSQPGRRTNEELFFAYYPRLLEWATKITRGDRTEAEDLIQDFYLRITRIARSIDEMDQLEGYLFRVLRNLYYARLRRAGRDLFDDLSIVEYDSVEQGLAVADRREMLFVRSHLTATCFYACQRKSTSRSAGVLILRFFLGYFPSEVMQILQVPRYLVDRALHVARNEVRLYLEQPDSLLSISSGKPMFVLFRRESGDDDGQDTFFKLRETIFHASEGECFGRAALEQRYAETEAPSSMTAQELAHLVSCQVCLDQVNQILHLPLLAERSPDESIDRDRGSGPRGDGGTGISRTRKKPVKKEPPTKKLERRARELFEHRPASLKIVVDGRVRSSQKVTAETNELKLTLSRKEEPSFVEVLSEQGFCLAYLQANSPDSAELLEQEETSSFSDNRSLVLKLSFASEVPIIQVVYRDPLIVAESEGSLADAFESDIKHAIFATPSTAAKTNLIELPRQFWRWIKRTFPSDMNPLLASAMLFTICALVCFVLWTRSGPQISAGTLLTRSEQADVAVGQSAPSEVIYQKVRITSSGRHAERAIYRDPQKKRRSKQQHLSPDDQLLKDKLKLAGVDWDEPLSAANYKEWRDRLPVKQDVVVRKGTNLLTLTTSTHEGGQIISESLTVRESDFHPVDRTIELRNREIVEIAELNYAVMPWGAVNQDWFEPLAGQAVSDVPMHAAIHLPRVLSEMELDQAELAARVTLNQLHADTGEPIQLTRKADGIDIKGVVDTDIRKQELVSRLTLVPHVHPSILSAEEIGSRAPSRLTVQGEQAIQVHSVEAQLSPLEQYMRERNLPIDQLATLSHNLLDGGLQIGQGEIHFSELQPRFREVNQLPMEARVQLASLSHIYLGTIESGLDANKRILLSLGFVDATTAILESTASEEDIAEQIRRYRQLCLELIINGTQQSRPAATIAEELFHTSERIHQHLATISATVPKDSN